MKDSTEGLYFLNYPSSTAIREWDHSSVEEKKIEAVGCQAYKGAHFFQKKLF